MGIISTAAVVAEEAAAEGSQMSPYVFGAAAFITLGALLVVTLMIKIDR